MYVCSSALCKGWCPLLVYTRVCCSISGCTWCSLHFVLIVNSSVFSAVLQVNSDTFLMNSKCDHRLDNSTAWYQNLKLFSCVFRIKKAVILYNLQLLIKASGVIINQDTELHINIIYLFLVENGRVVCLKFQTVSFSWSGN